MALNQRLDAEAARAITEIFTEVIIAPDASDEAIAIVGAKKNLRLLVTGGLPDPRAAGLDREIRRRRPAGAVARQCGGRRHEARGRDQARADQCRAADLRFAFRVAKHVKSNTIVYAKDRATVGIGAGQMSRIDSARIAARKAEDAAEAAA